MGNLFLDLTNLGKNGSALDWRHTHRPLFLADCRRDRHSPISTRQWCLSFGRVIEWRPAVGLCFVERSLYFYLDRFVGQRSIHS